MISVIFFSGLLGSLGHCLGMCGPLVILVGSQFGVISWTGRLWRYLLYHAARILVYFSMGLAIGALGSLVGLSGNVNHLTGSISLILGVGIILFGLRYLGWLPLGRLEGSGAWIGRSMKKAVQRGGWMGIASLGVLNGLLPCGLVYSALLASAALGTSLKAGAAMAAFGVGTLPALIVLGMGVQTISINLRQVMSRVAGLLIIIIGLQLVLRGAAGWGLLAHLKIGGVMIF